MIRGRFHVKDNWFFERLDDGGVRISAPDSLGPGASQIVDLDPNSWASIIAHVSHEGETSEKYFAALDFHGLNHD